MTDFWTFPEGGRVPDLADLLQAETLDDLQLLADPFFDIASAGAEAERLRVEGELRQVSADLAKKGVRFDADRAMRGSLWERVQDWFWDWRDARADATPPKTQMPSAQLFAVSVPLAQTRPPKQVAMDYDEQDEVLETFTDALARQISAQRGQAGWRVEVPDDVIDALAETDEIDADGNAVLEANHIVAYWPPHGQPALCLCVVRDESEVPVTVDLWAHGPAAHRRFVAILEGAGGHLRRPEP